MFTEGTIWLLTHGHIGEKRRKYSNIAFIEQM